MVSKFRSVASYIEELIYANQAGSKYPSGYARAFWEEYLSTGDNATLTYVSYVVGMRDTVGRTLGEIHKALADKYLAIAAAEDLVEYCRGLGIRTYDAVAEDDYWLKQGVKYEKNNPSELELLWDKTELLLTEADNLAEEPDKLSCALTDETWNDHLKALDEQDLAGACYSAVSARRCGHDFY